MISRLLIFLLLAGFSANAQQTFSFQIPARNANPEHQIYTAQIDELKSSQDYELLEIDGNQRTTIPFQIEGNIVYWKVSRNAENLYLKYELKEVSSASGASENNIKNEDGQFSIYQEGVKVFGYQHAIKEVPEGVNSAFRRSGYIHPLNTPSGKRLTRIQPEDHYHHYGIWNPWTHVEYEGDTLDFWNLNKRQATVRFANKIHSISGPIFDEFKVLHEHVVLNKGKNEVALNETQTFRTYRVDENSYIADITFTYNCATESPFKVLEYRYAGFGWRTTEEWDNQNSFVLSSEGKTRKDADGSTAKWCIVQGKLGNGKGGAVMMSHPTNFNHPEPLRIWPEGQYGRGDMFANFATTKNTDWLFEPGKTYTLQYRMLVFDGEVDAEKAEAAWNAFAKPIEIKVQ